MRGLATTTAAEAAARRREARVENCILLMVLGLLLFVLKEGLTSILMGLEDLKLRNFAGLNRVIEDVIDEEDKNFMCLLCCLCLVALPARHLCRCCFECH